MNTTKKFINKGFNQRILKMNTNMKYSFHMFHSLKFTATTPFLSHHVTSKEPLTPHFAA